MNSRRRKVYHLTGLPCKEKKDDIKWGKKCSTLNPEGKKTKQMEFLAT